MVFTGFSEAPCPIHYRSKADTHDDPLCPRGGAVGPLSGKMWKKKHLQDMPSSFILGIMILHYTLQWDILPNHHHSTRRKKNLTQQKIQHGRRVAGTCLRASQNPFSRVKRRPNISSSVTSTDSARPVQYMGEATLKQKPRRGLPSSLSSPCAPLCSCRETRHQDSQSQGASETTSHTLPFQHIQSVHWISSDTHTPIHRLINAWISYVGYSSIL